MMMKPLLRVVLVLCAGSMVMGSSRPIEAHPAQKRERVRVAGPIFNQDSTEFFFSHPAAEMSAQTVDDYIDLLARAGVKTFVSNVNAMRANYASKVWETDWHGYDPEGPDDQPVLRFLAPASIAPTRKRLDSAKKLADLGVNFHQRALARSRERGLGAWVSVRMNDVHDCMTEDTPLLSTFFKEQRAAKQLRAPHRDTSWADRALDWERPEVREHLFVLVKEQLETLDLDGLELDWMRFVFHFKPGRELAGGKILTEWIRRVRAECDRAAERLGHPVMLGVRVPALPETGRRLGLDAVAWAREGLVDLVVPSAYWATCDFDLPMIEWRRLLEGTGVQLAGGLEIRYQPVPNGSAKMMNPVLATGAAMSVLNGGADQVYLFNYFPGGHGLARDWGMDTFNTVVTAMQKIETLDALPRTHAVTYHDIRAPGEPRVNALPATNTQADMPWPPGCAFRIQTGPKPEGRAVEVLLEFAPDSIAPEKAKIYVNSVLCPPKAGASGNVHTYAVPAESLLDEAQVVDVVAADPFTIVRVELAIAGR